MTRIPGTFARARLELIPNPEYAGMTPRLTTAACHDRSPFITIGCSACGETSHVHETQILDVPSDLEIGMRCSNCRKTIVAEPGFFTKAFQQLRDDGWLA